MPVQCEHESWKCRLHKVPNKGLLVPIKLALNRRNISQNIIPPEFEILLDHGVIFKWIVPRHTQNYFGIGSKHGRRRVFIHSFMKVTRGHSFILCFTSFLLPWPRLGSKFAALLDNNCPFSLLHKTSQELRMLSSVTINCQITKIVMNSGSQLSVL